MEITRFAGRSAVVNRDRVVPIERRSSGRWRRGEEGWRGKARPRAVLKDVPPGERLKYPPAGAEFLFTAPV